jgi:hypothetical protein
VRNTFYSAFLSPPTKLSSRFWDGVGQMLSIPVVGQARGGSRSSGTLILKAEEVNACADVFTFKFSGVKLSNRDGFLGTSSPFLVFSRAREGMSLSGSADACEFSDGISLYSSFRFTIFVLCQMELLPVCGWVPTS